MNFAARFRKAFNAAFDVLIRRYVRGVIYFCRHRVLTWGILIASMVLLVVLMRTTKTGLVADETLPKGYSYEFGGITREESQSTGNTVLIFAICFVLVYLILSALYESFPFPLRWCWHCLSASLVVPCLLSSWGWRTTSICRPD